MTGLRKTVWCLLFTGSLTLAACDVFTKGTTEEYENAMKSWNAGDHGSAATQFLALAKKHPYSTLADNALYWAGMTQFLYLGETEKALQTLNFTLRKYPRRDTAAQCQYLIAQIYELGYNDYERAILEYRRASDYADREVREKSLYSLGDVLFRLGKADDAREAWSRQVMEFPGGMQSKLAYFRLGTASFTRGDLAEAESYYRRSLESDPDPDLAVKVKYALANCLEAGDQLQEALKFYRELLTVYPNRDALEIKIKALETRILKKSY